jgi:hypothetical protein
MINKIPPRQSTTNTINKPQQNKESEKTNKKQAQKTNEQKSKIKK